MRNSITALTRSGIKDWFIQRVSAVILALYVVFLAAYLLASPSVTFANWHALFSDLTMQIFTVLALLSLIAHAWVGVWTILTDYISCSILRAILQVLMVAAFVSYFVWAIMILWSV